MLDKIFESPFEKTGLRVLRGFRPGPTQTAEDG